ncbi:heat-inducible transcriptional repressor HrcA [Thioalkalivibrio sp. XN279]|uniref:heat-inducible transcriptional repressor HrcA n=1 Tax=Thioalkalivibrio sp. XN279 TaxID=2714953 RepID=UPI00140AACB0|nr:heat-inducible transcriptional repressor HrcA [Thioalkalivibrio sp. XN279]NHA14583.1 heat-inducible transcriptional repressor HrcA [Thioalkalivibrio sp. XN279]
MSNRVVEPELSDRARHLLKVLVERYLREGQPVGSRTLSKDSGLDLSPATIRNVMADLEEMGLVVAPHTSAGRVPTPKGIRLFVDALIKVQPMTDAEIRRLQAEMDAIRSGDGDIVGSASNLLSALTRMAGVVTVPRRSHAALRQVEFLPLSDRRILAILVIDEKEVQNRILHMDRDYSADELRVAANYLNEQFAGQTLSSLRDKLLADLADTRETMNSMMQQAISLARQAFETVDEPGQGFVLAGETNLMQFAELSNVERLRGLFEAFARQRDILHLLDKCLAAESLQIFIGEESGYRILESVSVVASPYSVEGEVVGVLGVIGPTRMAYDRIIPIVDITARLLGSALNSRE